MKAIEITGQHLLSGIGRYGWELSSELHQRGVVDQFYKPFKSGHPDEHFHDHSWVKGIKYRSFRNLHPYLLPLFIRKALKTDKSSILHAHWFLSGLAISSYKRNPMVITMHDVSLLHLPEKDKNYIKYYQWAINRFKRLEIPIIVVSESAKKDTIHFADYPNHLVHAIHNGINHEQFFPHENEKKRPKDRFRIVYSGGLGKRKNVDLLLKAFQLVEEKFNDVELVISGAHPDRTKYPQLTQELGLKNVIFTGFIADEKMADFYRSGHLMVFPSEYEGFGLAPLESMACGTPVLSATGGALKETSGLGAHYFEYDVDDLASKILQLKDDQSERALLTKKGLNQASNFTWSRTADETEKLYRSLS